METTYRTPVLTRSSVELAAFVSLCCVTLALFARWFVGVPESMIVLVTIGVASIIGWRRQAHDEAVETELQAILV